MKNLPIGVSDFEEIRNPDNNYVYVDKTMYIHRIVDRGLPYLFFHRPHGFGKSLMLSTLRAVFEGRKELFKGLYIEDKWHFKPYPVIYIQMKGGNYESEESLMEVVNRNLQENEERLGIPTSEESHMSIRFSNLIYEVHRKYDQRAVVLIDDYDKPFLDVFSNKELLDRNWHLMMGFYPVLKGVETHLRLAMLTGSCHFILATIFGGLNNLYDFGSHSDYATMLGFTQEELEKYYAEYLEGVDRDEMHRWYGGYRFTEVEEEDKGVYVPSDVTQFLHDKPKECLSYWSDSSRSDFIKRACHNYKKNLSLISLEDSRLSSPPPLSVNSVDYTAFIELLYQTGYMGLQDKQERQYYQYGFVKTCIPNLSLRLMLAQELIEFMVGAEKRKQWEVDGVQALRTRDMKMIEEHWNELFAACYYEKSPWGGDTLQAVYRGHAFTYCRLMQADVYVENADREEHMDMTILMEDRVYLCEFIEESRKADILKQLREGESVAKFKGQNKQITLVGVVCHPREDGEKVDPAIEVVWEDIK